MDLVLYPSTHLFPEQQELCNTSRFEIPFDQRLLSRGLNTISSSAQTMGEF